jgi:hypothetical protein
VKAAILLALAAAAAPAVAAQQEAAAPAGLHIPIRFLSALAGRHYTAGTPILAQTMAAIAVDSCAVVRPFVLVRGRVAPARRRGEIRVVFDSIASAGEWLPLSAVLDSLEYAPRSVTDSGTVRAEGHRVGKIERALFPVGAAIAAEILVAPAAVLGGYELVRRRRPAAIRAGELGGLRLTEPLRLPSPARCRPLTSLPRLLTPPALPRFVARTTDRRGERPGDPINLVLLASAPHLDSAFRSAGWAEAEPGSIRRVSLEVAAIVGGRPAARGAPVSAQYFEGRRQDVAYEFRGPTARTRHHVRLWLADTLQEAWVGAANRDAGLLVKPFRRTFTHRIDPDIDAERDLIVRELLASGCAALLGYVELPGAVTTGRNAAGQPFTTDGRTAVLRLHRCRDQRAVDDAEEDL